MRRRSAGRWRARRVDSSGEWASSRSRGVTHPVLVKAEELDVAADGLPGADGGHDHHLLAIDELESLVLGGVDAAGLVRGDVGAGGGELDGDRAADHLLLALGEWPGAHNMGGGPTHDPEAVDQRLGGERPELLEELIADLRRGCGGARGHGAKRDVGVGRLGGGRHGGADRRGGERAPGEGAKRAGHGGVLDSDRADPRGEKVLSWWSFTAHIPPRWEIV